MASTRTKVTLPEIGLNLDQLLSVVRALDPADKARVARVLAEAEMDSRLLRLMNSLATRNPIDSLTDREIQAEVNAVRQAR